MQAQRLAFHAQPTPSTSTAKAAQTPAKAMAHSPRTTPRRTKHQRGARPLRLRSRSPRHRTRRPRLKRRPYQPGQHSNSATMCSSSPHPPWSSRSTSSARPRSNCTAQPLLPQPTSSQNSSASAPMARPSSSTIGIARSTHLFPRLRRRHAAALALYPRPHLLHLRHGRPPAHRNRQQRLPSLRPQPGQR